MTLPKETSQYCRGEGRGAPVRKLNVQPGSSLWAARKMVRGSGT